MAMPKGDRKQARKKRKENRRKAVTKPAPKPKLPVHSRDSFLADRNIFTKHTIKSMRTVQKRKAALNPTKKVR